MCPTYLIFLDMIIQTTYGTYKLQSFSLCSLLQSPVTFFLSGPNIFLSTVFLNTLSLCSPLSVRDQIWHPFKTTGKIIVLYILILCFWVANWKTADSALNGSKHFLISVSSWCLHEWNYDLLGYFPNVWTVPALQRIYYLSLYFDFVLLAALKTWPCTWVVRPAFLNCKNITFKHNMFKV